MKVGITCFTARGAVLCRLIFRRFLMEGEDCRAYVPERFLTPGLTAEGVIVRDYSATEWAGKMFTEHRALVFIGAAGIAVRSIAPFILDKMSDPPVIALDEAGHFAIPLLSGHTGGANELAGRIAGWLNAVPVITTATDVNGLFAVDVFASKNQLTLTDRVEAMKISTAILSGETVGFFSDFPIAGAEHKPGSDNWRLLPAGCADKACDHNIWITIASEVPGSCMDTYGLSGRRVLRLIPKAVVIGIGCRKGVGGGLLEEKVLQVLADGRIDPLSVKALATIDIKKEEPALMELQSKYGWMLRCYSGEELGRVEGAFSESDFVKKAVGVGNVCERAASAQGGRLLIHKLASDGVTVAAALEEVELRLQWTLGRAFPETGTRPGGKQCSNT